jgi:ATP-dependent helicase/nuclease subunit A
MRPQLFTLLRLAQNFTQAFSESKRELGVVDFHDLEQHALRLLWDSQANQPTLIAGAWRKQLRFVFVDEYQDINAAQDRIIAALSRQGAQANRFLVGDVKQSIYRFRLANPHIFQGYVEQWSCGRGKAIPLVDNFRSREALLHFVNGLFGSMMDRNCGGVDYQQGAQLRFGAALERNQLSVANSPAPCAELHLRLKPQAGRSGEEPSEAMADLIQLEEAAKEARVVALRLRELKSQNHPVWDETLHTFRPVDWRDMAILLRSPANKSESYAKEFSHLNVPLEVVRGGFYRSLEVSDLLSLLQVLDNPLQDLPLLALLHSPLVGLSLNELAIIRLPSVKTRFWTALTRWAQAQNTGPTIQSPELLRKICALLDQFGRWRRLARQVSLSRCLEAVLAETHYADWLLTQPRGEQRHANVIRLLASAQEFDQFQRQGLFRFLRFIEAQQLAETEPQIPATSEQNAVRLMSIHQSKGLEFPVVVVADLGKPFNFVDIRAEIILDEKYGLCSLIKPPHSARRYPSLPYWLAQQRQAEEIVGEEMRLLYVAVTRSRDLLLLSGTMTETKFVRFQKQRQEPQAAGQGRLPADARSYIDWIVPWFLQTLDAGEIGPEGQNTLLRWFIHDDKRLAGYEPLTPVADQTVECGFEIKPGLLQQLQQRLTWRYPWISSTRQPAKLSVSALRRRAAIEESDDAAPAPGRAHSRRRQRRSAGASKRRRKAAMSELHGSEWAAEKGAANHLFLQLVSLDHVDSLEQLNRESQRLQVAGALTPAEAQLLDLEAVAAFWCSSLGRRIGDKAQFVHRELAFTARFALTDLADIAPQLVQPDTEGEFVIVRGVADLVVLLPREIWVLDFKTDAVQPGDLTDKAEQYYPQLRLYARALAGIYRRPVTESWLYFLGPRQAIPTSKDPLLKHSSLQGEFPGL